MTRSPRTRLRVESLEDRAVPAVHTWTDASQFTNNWSDAANWNGGVPTTGESGGTIVVFPTSDLSINQDIAGLVVDRIDFTSPGNTLTLVVPLGLNGSVSTNNITNTSGANTISGVGSINLTGATCLVPVTGGSLTITSTITGGQNFSKAGAGTLTLTGNNTYTGQTSVGGGTLVLDNPSASTYTYTGGDININGQSTFRIATTGTSKRYDFQGKTFRFGGGGGTIDIPDAAANIVFSTGANVTNTIVTNGGARNAITGAGGFNLGALASNTTAFNIARGTDPTSDLTVSAPLTNGGAVTKSGAGILTFTAASTYTGTTTIADGVMVLQVPVANSNAALGSGTSVVVGDGTGAAGSAVLRLNNQIGQINNAATLTVNGEGRVEVAATSGDSFPGVILNGGTIDIAAGGFLDLQSGGTLTASATATGSQITGAGSFGLRGPVAVTIAVADGAAANDLTIAASIGDSAGSGTGSLTKTGAGILTLTGANTYTGTTTNNGGVNGALQIGNGGTTGTLGTGAVTNNGSLVFNRSNLSNTLVVPNTLNGLGTINQVGGGTTVLNGPVSSGFFNTSVSATAGTLLLNGLVSLAPPPGTPGVVVPGGFLGGVGTINAPVQVQNLGVIGPGSATATGTLNTAGVSFLAGGAFGVKVAGGGAGQFDVLNVTGTVNLTNGAIFVVSTAAPPAAGTVLTVIANDGADAVVGTFAGLPEGGAVPDGAGTTYTISYVGGDGNDVTLTVANIAPPPPPLGGLPAALLVTGPGGGNGLLFTPAGGLYGAGVPVPLVPGFGGELHVALGDVNADGTPDRVVGTGPGDSRVRVLDGANGAVLADFVAFPGYTGGVFVAAGDLNGDGRADVAVTPDAVDAFSGPVGSQLPVRVYTGAGFGLLASFDGLASLNGASGQGNLAVKLGGRPAIADVNGDGLPDLLIAAGSGGGPRITVWSGAGFPGAGGGRPTTNPIANLFVFESSQRGGAFITSGDVNGDRFAEVIVGGGPGGGPRVRIVNAQLLFNPAVVPNLEGVNLDDPTNLSNGLVLNNFFAGSANNRGGVRVTVRDVDLDGRADVVTGSGAGDLSAVRVYRAPSLAGAAGSSSDPGGAQVFDPFGAVLAGGVWVG